MSHILKICLVYVYTRNIQQENRDLLSDLHNKADVFERLRLSYDLRTTSDKIVNGC